MYLSLQLGCSWPALSFRLKHKPSCHRRMAAIPAATRRKGKTHFKAPPPAVSILLLGRERWISTPETTIRQWGRQRFCSTPLGQRTQPLELTRSSTTTAVARTQPTERSPSLAIPPAAATR